MATINGTSFNDNGTFQFTSTFPFVKFFPVLNGTAGNDTINGLAGNDILNGLGGADILNGGSGNDTLRGGNGNDLLNGGSGADNMNGGDQNDTYIVDNVGDTAAETFNDALGGVDTVQSSVNHTLGFGIEHLTLTGSSAINGTGNANANTITGNSAANVLTGRAGNDTLNGLGGNDTLFGGGGNDTLNGGAGNNTLDGGAGNDTIIGGSGNDRITGGSGADSLTSSVGSNVFVYNSVSDSPSGGGRDIIQDFGGSFDDIDLRGVDANSTEGGNQAFTYIGSNPFSGFFFANPGQLRYSGGVLQGNTDFDFAPEFEIQLAGAPSLSVSDLFL
jgi:Ca2+-binding RTX toxin-like protein